MSRPRLSLALSIALATPLAVAQNAAPNACASSSAASLLPTSRYTPVRAVITAPDTLWVLYSTHDARNIDAVSLLEVRHVGNGHNLEVETHEVGEGTVTAGSLAVVGDNIVGAWVQPAHHVGVFTYATARGGSMQHISLDAPHPPTSVSVAAAGNGALVTWDDNARALRRARIDAHGALVGTVFTLRGRYGMPVATSAFGGSIAMQNGAGAAAHIGLLAGDGRRPVGARGAARVAGASFPSVAGSADRAHVLFTARGTAHLTTLDNATGAGRDRTLGPSGLVGETGIGATSWGSYAAWTRDGAINVVPVESNGAMVGTPFEITDPASPERARSPAVATAPRIAAVVWWGAPSRRPAGSAGTIRFVRLDCH